MSFPPFLFLPSILCRIIHLFSLFSQFHGCFSFDYYSYIHTSVSACVSKCKRIHKFYLLFSVASIYVVSGLSAWHLTPAVAGWSQPQGEAISLLNIHQLPTVVCLQLGPLEISCFHNDMSVY